MLKTQLNLNRIYKFPIIPHLRLRNLGAAMDLLILKVGWILKSLW